MVQRVGRGIALLFHDRGTRSGWVVSSTPRPHFTPGKDQVPILQEAGWPPGPVWTGGKSRPHRDFFYVYTLVCNNIQDVPKPMSQTSPGYSPPLIKQKRSYQHGSKSEQVPRYTLLCRNPRNAVINKKHATMSNA